MLYEKEARLNVPGTGAQGVVVDATETVVGFPVYAMRWLTEAGETLSGTVGEGDLRRANRTDADIARAADAEARRLGELDNAFERGVEDGRKATLAEQRARSRKRPTKTKTTKRKR